MRITSARWGEVYDETLILGVDGVECYVTIPQKPLFYGNEYVFILTSSPEIEGQLISADINNGDGDGKTTSFDNLTDDPVVLKLTKDFLKAVLGKPYSFEDKIIF